MYLFSRGIHPRRYILKENIYLFYWKSDNMVTTESKLQLPTDSCYSCVNDTEYECISWCTIIWITQVFESFETHRWQRPQWDSKRKTRGSNPGH